jgi:hypothetical protein
LTASRAFAATPSPAEIAAAQALFNDARALFTSGDIAAACSKFEASQKLDPRTGTLLNLAICRQKEGKTASAWVAFNEARAAAHGERLAEREKFASDRIAELTPRLSHLVVSPTRVPGLSVELDGGALREDAWGADLPVDPGPHTILATAPSCETWRGTITLGDRGDHQVVTVPALQCAGTGAAALSAARSDGTTAPGSGRRLVGFAVGGGGLAAVAVGGVFGALAIVQRHDAENACPVAPCSSTALQANSTGVTYAWVSDFAIGAGLAALGVGTALVLTAPSGGLRSAASRPVITVSGSGAAFRAEF